MGLRLLILSWWTPKYIIRKELENISDKTTKALEGLIAKYGAKTIDPKNQSQNQNQLSSNDIEELRAAMARTQAKLVETLAATVGTEEAIRAGREALFPVGQSLGKKARSQLGVGDGSSDLTKAAKILYRVLGIEFHVQWHSQASATVIIDKCALALQYSKLTCQILSATDEGVIRGLQPKVTMKFKEYIPNGCKNCLAEITLGDKEVVS